MKKAIFYLLACVLLPVAASADEGMWLVSTFRDVIYPQMKKEGLKLKPGEIYNEESPALCNAIVAVDGGMGTGSVISDKGLVITNHHVAYGDIHSLSTPAKNYLEEGFWALEQKDELPLKGKTVTFLRQVRDVTRPRPSATRSKRPTAWASSGRARSTASSNGSTAGTPPSKWSAPRCGRARNTCFSTTRPIRMCASWVRLP